MVNSHTNMHGSLHLPVSFQPVKLYTLSVVVHDYQDEISKLYFIYILQVYSFKIMLGSVVVIVVIVGVIVIVVVVVVVVAIVVSHTYFEMV